MSAVVAPGSAFAGYRVEAVVGRGGMGVVYRAIDPSLARPVALKLIAPEHAEDERFRTRFLREPRLAASLDHPNVVPIYAAGEAEGRLYLAMRFVDGSDLRRLLEAEGRLAPWRALAILGQVAGALDAAHERGLVHRDVKPGNVLVDESGHSYLSDFGVTKHVGHASTETGEMAGTLDYVAPEQIRGEPVDGRADVYALACVLYECLTGEPPFRRETEAETLFAHLQDDPAPLPDHPALDPVLARGLARQREDRCRTCTELVDGASAALGFEPPARRARRLRAGRRLMLAGALMLAATAAAAAVVELTDDHRGGLAPVAPDSVAVLAPGSNAIVGQVRIPGGPSLAAASGAAVWVGSAGGTLSAVDHRSLAVSRVVPANVIPEDLVATGDALWLLDAERGALVKLDPAYGSVTRRVALPARARPNSADGFGLDAGLGAVWVTDGTSRLLKLDPRDGSTLRRIDLRRPLDDVAVGADAVWVISGASGSVLGIDPASGAILARVAIAGRPGVTRPVPVAVAAGEGGVWVLNADTPSVTRIDPRLGAVTATIPLGVGSNPGGIAAGAGAVWVALSGAGAVARIDPDTGAVRSIPVGGAPVEVAVGLGRVWVSVWPGFRTGLADRGQTVEVPGAISEPFCSPVEFAGEGTPRLLIVSDFPLQTNLGAMQPLQLTDAIRFVLARHGFRAGRYSVGYQSCDDSSRTGPQPRFGDWTPATCRRNARAYASRPMVIGVIGPYNSGCAAFEIPILNAARGGPLATISGSTTYVGLTRRSHGAAPGEPEAYYPRGVRNFARVVAADDVQGAAAALMAKRLGVTGLYVLDNAEPYGIGIAASMRRAASELGIAIAGSGRWDARDRGFRALARRIERSGADGVFLGGELGANGVTLLRDLHAVLGTRVQVLAPDGFSEFPALVAQVGAAAEGLVVSIPIVPAERLPASGRSFVEAFERALGRAAADPYAITTAQATEVLLQAIAASDGTRASVTAKLFDTRVASGILGSFELDANGDTNAAGVTLYRIEGGKPRVLSVITPPASLVR